ncbi:MAG: ABC-2 family transporter protein [Lachnospiraceae bacterium]|nr:ABC-2 family transporter protein [Lachnospiraceae bacterium]
MKKYLSFFRLRFLMGLQYRAAALGGIATQFAWGFLEITVMKAFYETNPPAYPMEFQATVSYIWLQQAFLAFFAVWMVENDIFEMIISGNIVYELCRPIRIYSMLAARNLANRISRAVLRCIPILAVAVFLPKPYRMGAPAGVGQFLLFLLAMVLGLLVTVSFFMLIYVFAFYTISPQGLRIILSSLVEFLSGGVIPLPFFPEPVLRVLELLPFASMQNVPLRIYGGDITGAETLRAIGLQVFWLILMTFVGSILCRAAEQKTALQGG